MTIPTRTGLAAALALALGLTAVGCTNNAGLTNGPPPTSTDKSATRTDLPTPEAPDRGTPPGSVNTAGGNDLGGTGTSGGTGARNGGREGAEATTPDRDKAVGTNKPNPPVLEAPASNNASGETKPAGNIEVGTPRSPQ